MNNFVNRLEIDLDKLEYNLQQIKNCVGNNVELLPVIKANAYGLGAVSLKDVLERNGINYIAVAVLKEAKELRENNFNMNIILLNEILANEIPEIVKYRLTVGISSYEIAKKLNEESKKDGVITKVHIKIDTGRLFAISKLLPLIKLVKEYEDLVAKVKTSNAVKNANILSKTIKQIQGEILGLDTAT